MSDPVNSTGGVQPSQHPQHQPNTKKEDVEVSYQQYHQTQDGLVNTAAAYSDTQGPTTDKTQATGNQNSTDKSSDSTDKSSDSDDNKAKEKQQAMKHMRSEGQQRRQGIKKEYQDEKQIAEDS